MNLTELIRTRKSFRTYDGRPLEAEDLQKLKDFAANVTNPYGIPVEFVFLDAKEAGLATPVIVGEPMYVAAKVKKAPHYQEAYGYTFEKFVLYAWSLGVGTTWIGGTMDRPAFEAAFGKADDEVMPIVSPLGYPAEERSDVDIKLRTGVKGDWRLPASELFFDGNFDTPLTETDPACAEQLELIRWAPSAANKQPTRIVRVGNAFHFYEKHTEGYGAGPWDIQRIDMGITLNHFLDAIGGTLTVEDPGIPVPEGTDYIATITL